MCLCPVLLCSLLPWFSGVRFYCLSPLIKMCIFFFLFLFSQMQVANSERRKRNRKTRKVLQGKRRYVREPCVSGCPSGRLRTHCFYLMLQRLPLGMRAAEVVEMPFCARSRCWFVHLVLERYGPTLPLSASS